MPPSDDHTQAPGDAASATQRTMPMDLGGSGGPEPTVDLSASPAARTSATLHTIPERIGPYTVGEKLGEGGMGSVYRATDGDGREVALKVLRPVLVSEDGFAERFQREAQVAARVEHEHVVRLLDHGEADGHHFMVFELLTGGDLGDLIKRRTVLTQAKALSLLREAACGLQAIHQAGLVHRDIKPGNLFLDHGDRVRIGDLGLARGADGDDRMTMTGVAMGTPAYMSPEHVQGVADIDIRTDIYALGATLYKMLTGHDPYVGDTLYMVTSQVLNEPIPDPRMHDPGISPEAAAIVRKAMAKDRDQRYATPDELAQDCERALAGQPLLYAQVDVQAPKLPAGDGSRRQSSGAAAALGRSPRSAPRIPVRLVRMGLIGGVLFAILFGLSRLPDALTVSEADAPERPEWAYEMGRDQYGHWAELPFAGGTIRLRYCPPGSFLMGSAPDEPGRAAHEVQREVTLRRGFWIADREVTQAMWRAVMGHNHSTFDDDPKLPVETLDWYEAVAFCEQLGANWPQQVVRLPTEAEWEYACRAGSGHPYGPAKANPDDIGVFAPGPLRHVWREAAELELPPFARDEQLAATFDQYDGDPRFRPQAAGSRDPNAWGLYDMHGNLAEWCRDAWDGETPPAEEAATVDPEGTTGELRVVRGGSWYEPPAHGRAAARQARDPEQLDFDLGFRFVIEHRPAVVQGE